MRPWIKSPGEDWRVIDASDPSQQGYYSVPFNGTISDNLSSFVFYKYGAIERFDFRNGNMGITHRVSNASKVDAESSILFRLINGHM